MHPFSVMPVCNLCIGATGHHCISHLEILLQRTAPGCSIMPCRGGPGLRLLLLDYYLSLCPRNKYAL